MAIDDVTFTPSCAKYNGTIPTRPPTTPYTGPSTTTTTSTTTQYTGPSTTTTTSTTTLYTGPSTTTTVPLTTTTTPYIGKVFLKSKKKRLLIVFIIRMCWIRVSKWWYL
jgi:hypothetical protein